MTEKLRALSAHPIVTFLHKVIGDPVQLYAVFLIMTVMYYYHAAFTWAYTLVAVFLTLAVMKFYDFVARHKWLGPLSYIGYMVAGLYIVGMVARFGQTVYPISFGVWFLTPQSVVDFSQWYTIAIYMLMFGFLTSTVYYFSKVRYRMTMQFVIMLIPLSLYGKEGIQMPALLVIMLFAGFFLLMVYCRNLRDDGTVRRIHGLPERLSVALFVAAYTIIAAIFPKPAVEADREYIENAMSYSTLSDVLMNAISMFTDSTNNRVASSSNGRTLYYASAPEELRLRTQTYSYYLANDSWNVIHLYDYADSDLTEPMTYAPRSVLQALCDAAALDGDFAEEYGIAEFAGTQLPEQDERMLFLFSPYESRMLPTATRAFMFIEGVSKSYTEMSWALTLDAPGYGDTTTQYYYSDTYADRVATLLSCLSMDEYPEMLTQAQAILDKAGETDSAELLAQVLIEQEAAAEYAGECSTQDYHSETVEALAAQLTQGLTSDYDKAKAIEQYFLREGYVYDMAYEKADDENVDDFLNTTHRGVCYEYATAMVLLCRSAGLPARYVQGYNMNEPYNSNIGGRSTNFVIKVRNAHAFPEVYISGYGWLSFEPTVPGDDLGDGRAENVIVTVWGFVLLGLFGIALLLWLSRPRIREALFRRRLRRMSARDGAAAIFRRQRLLLHLPESTTVSALYLASGAFWQDAGAYRTLDALLYSEEAQGDAASLYGFYTKWSDAKREHEKLEKKRRRAQRRQNKHKENAA